MAEIRRWAKSHDSASLQVGHGASQAYKVLIKRLREGIPREVPCLVQSQVWRVFTDGAAEGDSNTIGGVLRRKGEDRVRFFACKVPETLVREWAHDMEHVIGPVGICSVGSQAGVASVHCRFSCSVPRGQLWCDGCVYI